MRDYPYASGALCAARAPRMAWITLALALAPTACGGDGSGDPGVSPPPASGAPEKPASRAEAARFLTQATFGPTDAEVDHVMSIGYSAWIDEQFAKPASSNLALWDANATANNATVNAAQHGTTHAFWRNAISGDDQLRQRVAYSLSQIFVISMQDANVDARAAAGFLDMLGDKGMGNYRDVIEAARHQAAARLSRCIRCWARCRRCSTPTSGSRSSPTSARWSSR